MRAKTWTSAVALALLVFAPISAQLPGESVDLGPTAAADSAAVAPQPVEGTSPPDALIGTVDAPDRESVTGELQSAEDAAVQAPAEPPAEAPMPAATVESTATEATAAQTAEFDEALPRTASPLALIALLGAGSVGSAIGLRFARRRR